MSKKVVVFYVDNEPDWIFTIKGTLSDHGYLVRVFDNIAEAKARKDEADIFVVDGNVAEEDARDGFAFAKELHSEGRIVCNLSGDTYASKNVPQFEKCAVDRLVTWVASQ